MIEQYCDTYEVKLFLSGPIEEAKQILRKECLEEGLCVTIAPTAYIYTGGEEQGYIVGFINYARFPKEQEEIYNRAKNILYKLIEGTYQYSGSIVSKDKTEFVSHEGKK